VPRRAQADTEIDSSPVPALMNNRNVKPSRPRIQPADATMVTEIDHAIPDLPTVPSPHTRVRRLSEAATQPRKRLRTESLPTTEVDVPTRPPAPINTSASTTEASGVRVLANEQEDLDCKLICIYNRTILLTKQPLDMMHVLSAMEERPAALRDLLAPLKSTVLHRPDSVLTTLEKYWRSMRTHFFQPVDLETNSTRRLKPIDAVPVCILPGVASPREANAILLVWAMHYQWPSVG
jgi:hypothetical protein